MEKQRKIKILTVVALIIAVLGLTVAFAALSQTLTINGTAGVNTASWNVHFDEDSVNITGAKNDFSLNHLDGDLYKDMVKQQPVISGTSISNYKITFTGPGDMINLTAVIKNDGTIDAKLDDIITNKNSLRCSSSSGIAADETLVCDNLDILYLVLTQEEYEKMQESSNFTEEEIKGMYKNYYYFYMDLFNNYIEDYGNGVDKVIKPGESLYLYYIVGYNFDVSQELSDKVEVSNLDLSLNFVQS